MSEGKTRRELLKIGGTAAVAGLAGCTSILEEEDENQGPGQTDNGSDDYEQDNDEDGPDYKLEVSAEDVDLSDLKNWEHTSDEIRSSDYAELEVTLYEDDEPVEPDQLEISSTDQLEYDLQDSLYQIKCTELEQGRNQLEIQAEYNGEEITDTVNVEKTTPDQYLLQGSIEFENKETIQVIPSSTPYKFDKHTTDYEEFTEKRLTGVENNNVPEAVDEFDPETIEDVDDKVELIEVVADHVRDVVGGHSGSAGTQAATEETIIREHTDFEDVYAAGFDNPHDRTSDSTGNNHGSKSMYLDGDWYHVETTHTEVRHIDNADNASMVSGMGQLSNFVSILGEFEKGDMEELNYRTKMNRKQGMYVGNTVPSGIITTSDMTVSDPFGSEGLEMKRDNKPRKEIYAAPILAADHFLQTSKPGIIFGTPDQPEILVTENRRLHERVEEQLEYQELETILEKL